MGIVPFLSLVASLVYRTCTLALWEFGPSGPLGPERAIRFAQCFAILNKTHGPHPAVTASDLPAAREVLSTTRTPTVTVGQNNQRTEIRHGSSREERTGYARKVWGAHHPILKSEKRGARRRPVKIGFMSQSQRVLENPHRHQAIADNQPCRDHADHAHQLDQNVQAGTAGVLKRITHRIANDTGLMGI